MADAKITALTEPVPSDVPAFYQAVIGTGTAVNGTFYVTDGVGTVAGVPHTENFTIINAAINTLETAGDLAPITDIMAVMIDVVNETYLTGFDDEELEIPFGLPGAGTYPNKASAMAQLQIEADAGVTILTAAHPTEVADANAAFQSSIDHILLELDTLAKASVRFQTTYTTYDATPTDGSPQPSQQTTLSFAANLHSYGIQTDKGNIAEIMEKMVTDTRGGEAIVGAMREGRNLKKLDKIGVSADNKIDDTPEVTIPGDIQPSSY